MTEDTLFHKIIRREIPADIVYEDEHMVAFRDIAPQAPVHVLFVPKTTVATLNDLQDAQAEVVGRLALAATRYDEAGRFRRGRISHRHQLQCAWRADGVPAASDTCWRGAPRAFWYAAVEMMVSGW